MPFVGFNSNLTIKQLFAMHDWEEPHPLSSDWLQRRRALVAKVREQLIEKLGEEEADFYTFSFAYLLHNTGQKTSRGVAAEGVLRKLIVCEDFDKYTYKMSVAVPGRLGARASGPGCHHLVFLIYRVYICIHLVRKSLVFLEPIQLQPFSCFLNW